MPQPILITSGVQAREKILAIQQQGLKVGLVPTMGALHEGHTSLVDAARRECQFTVVSIFVNPAQFAPHEDLAKYPRTLDADLQLLAAHGADLVFCPTAQEMYGGNFDTYVTPGKIAEVLEGVVRPTHFRGVATVVLKLFNLLPADIAYFGQKDYQQSLVIRHLVADLNVPIEIRVCPIIRELDGLAKSSRNVYLSPDERRSAIVLSQAVQKAEEHVRMGERSAANIVRAMQTVIESVPGVQVNYIVVADPETLADVTTISGSAVALIAARVGNTRLIDNTILQVS